MRIIIMFIGFIGFLTHAIGQDVLMQGWYWDYPKTTQGENWSDTISLHATKLADAGITHVWLPPLSRASFGNGSNGYDPKDLYDLGEYGLGATGYGTRAQLDASITILNAEGIKAVADVVYNHRDGGLPEVNPAVEGWIENYNCTKRDAGDQAFPSDRYRIILPIGGSTGNGAGTYYIKVRSVSKHPDFYNYGYRFYAQTNVVGYQGLPDEDEDEAAGNGGGDCGQSFKSASLGIGITATIDDVGSCGGSCGIDEYALTVNTADFNSSGDTLYFYLNNTGGYSDHFIAGLWNGSADVQEQLIYQTYTDFSSMPSGQGGMTYLNFKPNGNPTQLSGDEDGMYFFYDYDQYVTSTQETLRDWSSWLLSDVGIEGFRMDAVKHFPASFVSYLMNELSAQGNIPDIVVGESFDTNPWNLKNWTEAVNNGMNAAAQSEIDVRVFDFALRQSLKDASDAFGYDVRNIFQSGVVRGANGNKDHVVTFANNHDYRDHDQPILNDPLLAYAYILTNPQIGIPTVFYSDFFGIANANAPIQALEHDIKMLSHINKQYIHDAQSVDYISEFGSLYPINFDSGFASTSLIYQTNQGGMNSDQTAIVVINYAGEELIADFGINMNNLVNGYEFVDMTGKSQIHKTTIANNMVKVQVPARSYAIYIVNPSTTDCNLGPIVYVDKESSGLNNGHDWIHPFKNLSGALSMAEYCTDIEEIRIKEGTYHPNILDDRDEGFEIRNGLKIIGSFPLLGSPELGEEDVLSHPTILSGNIGDASLSDDNVYHVVKTNAGIDTSVLESIVISDGQADGADIGDQTGAGIMNEYKLNLLKVHLANNYSTGEGAGLFNHGSAAEAILDQVIMVGNTGLSVVRNKDGAKTKVKNLNQILE